MNWHQIELGSSLHVKHGFAFKGEFFTDAGEFMVLTPGNFLEEGGFRVRDGKERFYSSDIPEAYILEENDLIIAMTEQGEGLLGSTARVPASNRYLHNQRLGLVQRVDETRLDNRFLYWLLNSRNVREQIRSSATGAKVKHTAPERIYKVKVDVPVDVAEQHAIGSTLDNYNDLIATNQRRIQLLEEAARRLYREWFVHLRFPGREQTNIVNGVPEGWQNLTFEDVCDAIGGGTPSTKCPEYWSGEITWVTPTDITRNDCLYLIDSEKKITEDGLQNSSSKLLPANAVLMTSRASIGFFALLDKPVCTNQGFISVVPKAKYARMYLLFNLMGRTEEMLGLATGSTFKELSKKSFKAMPILWPSLLLLERFCEQAEIYFEQIKTLKLQNHNLKLARDGLLPRLMSGALKV